MREGECGKEGVGGRDDEEGGCRKEGGRGRVLKGGLVNIRDYDQY